MTCIAAHVPAHRHDGLAYGDPSKAPCPACEHEDELGDETVTFWQDAAARG